MSTLSLDIIQLSDWKDIARSKGGFRDWLAFWGLSDDVTARPVERQAFVNLEAAAWSTKWLDVPLSPLERECLAWERMFLKEYRTKEFIQRYGMLSVGDRYAFVASKIPHMGRFQAKAILEEVSIVLKAAALDEAADAMVAEMLSQRAA